MNDVLTFLSEHPLYAVGAGLLVLFIVVSIVKQLLKVALVLFVIFACYLSATELVHRFSQKGERAAENRPSHHQAF